MKLIVCDIAGCTASEETDFDDSDMSMQSGWVHVDLDGKPTDLCPDHRDTWVAACHAAKQARNDAFQRVFGGGQP